MRNKSPFATNLNSASSLAMANQLMYKDESFISGLPLTHRDHKPLNSDLKKQNYDEASVTETEIGFN